MISARLHPCSLNVAHLTRELDVQRRFKSTAAQADKLRNHIQIISEMTEDELQHFTTSSSLERMARKIFERAGN